MPPLRVQRFRRRHTRLDHLEAMLQPNEPGPAATTTQSEEQWLVRFRQWERSQLYQKERDFPWLIHRYEQALQQAQASIDPPFNPPAEFEPHVEESLRLYHWRTQWRFPEVHRTLLALLTMTAGALQGQVSVSRAEWESMKAWYLGARASLPISCGAIKLPTGRSLSSSSIDHELQVNDGIIMETALTVYRDMRELHQHFGNTGAT